MTRTMRMLLAGLFAFAAIMVLWTTWPSPPEAQERATTGSETGLPIPRFVTLRADEVNLRTGPGTRYPIDWIFVRRNLPVEIVAEFDKWRKIRDFEGTEGWVHQSMLSGRRSLLVLGQIRTLHREPSDSAAAVARLEPGVIARLDACKDDWCEVEVSGLGGWIHRAHVWGIPDHASAN